MAQSSQDILNQINQQYGNIGSAANTIESTIKNAYAPSIKALVEEGNTLRGQYYPAFFNEAQRLGTTAADMSPAARLAAMQSAGENMGQLYRTNLGLRDFYNTDINNLVGRAQNQYMNAYNALKDQYTMALQGEQLRAQQSQNSAYAKYLQALIDNMNKPPPGTTTTTEPNISVDVYNKPLMSLGLGDLTSQAAGNIFSKYGISDIGAGLQNAYKQYLEPTVPKFPVVSPYMGGTIGQTNLGVLEPTMDYTGLSNLISPDVNNFNTNPAYGTTANKIVGY